MQSAKVKRILIGKLGGFQRNHILRSTADVRERRKNNDQSSVATLYRAKKNGNLTSVAYLTKIDVITSVQKGSKKWKCINVT